MVGAKAAAAIGARDDLEDVAVGIVEIDAAPIVPTVDLTGLLMKGIGPIIERACLNTGKNCVEVPLAHEEGKMARIDRLIGLDKVERCRADLYDGEMTQLFWRIQRQYFGQEGRCRRAVARADDRVVESDRTAGHAALPFCIIVLSVLHRHRMI